MLFTEENYVSHSGTTMRVGSAGRLATPRSTGSYAFEIAGDSEDEGTEIASGEDHVLSYKNVKLILLFLDYQFIYMLI